MWMQRAAQDAGVCERPAPQARWGRGREVGQAPCGFTAAWGPESSGAGHAAQHQPHVCPSAASSSIS